MKIKNHNRIYLKYFIPGILLLFLLTSCAGPQKTDIPCKINFNNGQLVSDSCKEISSAYYCDAGLSKYDEEVKRGDEIEAGGVCYKSREGEGYIGP